ncbi:hypothetical protein FRC03_010585 [Tulasnella sp. 419]|nr:hypothetical protein FRC03_010585 [Tulasnella sp. 419]
MIDYYGHGNFKAWTDCGLDLGWSHPNATNPPQWPANDCYHTCNTNCTTNTSTDGGSNNGGNNNTGNGNGGGQNQNAALKNSAVAVLLTTMVAGLTASFLCF